MTAFIELARKSVDLVECDIHLSADDGELVVIHGDNLLRTAGVDRRVAEMTRAQLAAVDVGDGGGVPSLTDVLEAVHVATSAGCRMLSFHHEGLQPEYVDRCHSGDILVSVWAPDTPETIRSAIAAGVDGIGSDRPDLVKKILAEMEVGG